MRILWYEFKMEMLSTLRYRASVISDATIFTMLLLVFILSNTGMSLASKYQQANHVSLLLLGYISWLLSLNSVTTVTNEIRSELQRGTLYQKLYAKLPLQVLFVSKVLAGVMIQLVIILLFIVVTHFFMGIPFYFNGYMLLTLVIALAGMYGIGVAIAGISLFIKKTGSILLIIQMLLLFITDTVPTNNKILLVSKYIPLTISNDIIRRVYANMPMDHGLFTELVISSLVFLIAGNVIFQMMLKKAKKTGNLLMY